MLIPNIELKNGMWNGKIHLEYWNNFFQNKEDIELNIGGDSKTEKLEESHKNGYEYISSNQEELLNLILKELLKQYPILQEEYGYEEEELEEIMPNVEQILDFRKLIKPKRIYILNIENDGIPYIGVHFLCSWDEEQDFGVMLNKDRIIKMGGADTAFLSWIAKNDKKALN
ncbi:DUF6985 domain-containing protein [Clostridium saccharobutylicum]|uniref:DUF6985 domain-containing protein n=1 Tax=Clostridium saccharobutylicum DSM 13864 TaxID=1345695 RepID=U5MYP1_CLOSA|nr:hypothetical protein [Clostridium saccharobutylicum]AGX44612.1 hypothetical protein CLSA_c36510 [Clostridium saccharobutylicum DSM 13864]AQR91903.1 hypothetical protein CLOSC_36310 [Clostridium saccharobutylicum]AQS01805.1 hypothetical protein CSACC_36360 [Clostridium saccharobutylicum]AQS11407.1 hypothetical protein CLOBY_35630 [Clostridium saccharobutylicum]AQS15788.1 hypothetical protein CLOSACC_36360 [Clostridium saccharobutylicum]